ncbi:unnamed protein product [Lactuca virosa]|uniref:Uncharacterized protein n=1 Tax=Lactuca virosa TaxID=75947 RepID=A0AAU9P5V5_9ASTR|nr:unnamed protein product [Lactuca virosa]
MESKKQESGSPSSSSFTETLFGLKDSGSSSSSGRFGSVFGPSSTGLAKDTSHCSKYTGTGTGSSNNQDPNGATASRGNWWQGSLYY